MAADGPNHRGYIARSAATARCRTATSCALSGAHSSTRPVRGELGSAPRPAAGEHERSGELVTLRSEQNVKILSEPLAQLAYASPWDSGNQRRKASTFLSRVTNCSATRPSHAAATKSRAPQGATTVVVGSPTGRPVYAVYSTRRACLTLEVLTHAPKEPAAGRRS